jgi:hypothetical protein
MKQAFFVEQFERLRRRFGEKAMDDEFKALVAEACFTMSEPELKRTVDVFIGSRPHTKPPLLTDFRDAAQAEANRNFKADVRWAANFVTRRAPADMKAQLKRTLSQEYGGVDSVSDALAIARIRNQTRESV